MSKRCHVHEIELTAPPEQVFNLLLTPSAIRGWWSAARAVVIPREGGTWAAAWGMDEDKPDYVTSATITVCEPPHCLVFGNYQYYARTGSLPFEVNFTTEFTIELTAVGSRLRVRQDGFPEDPAADEFYAACEQGWRNTFEGIRDYLANRSD
jgi:uncharacterized protein YndB with AHSA1/START domain